MIMNNIDKEFNSVFEGLSKTLNAVDSELDLLKKINDEQKEELKKSKRFNIIMFVIAIASFVVSLVSLGVAFL